MKLAIGYSSKDQVELTKQTLPRIMHDDIDLYWCDGSRIDEGVGFFEDHPEGARMLSSACIFGGADVAIAWKLSIMLNSRAHYTHIGLIENDVLLDADWLEPTLELFEKGKADGLCVGAVSPRSYVDRVLIQRHGYAVMHNIGAGAVIFTREAAEIILRTFRTTWWPDNVRLFGQLSGIDLRTYAAFRGNEQWVTTDWGWEAQLARHGLASLALTPARCQMLGQNPPLAQQGLELTTVEFIDRGPWSTDPTVFNQYRDNLLRIRKSGIRYDSPGMLHRQNNETLVFPHQLGAIDTEWRGSLELQNSQGFGPFAYRAGKGGASLSAHVSGSISFLVTGGRDGSTACIRDHRSGYKFDPKLPPDVGQPISLAIPGRPTTRQVTIDLAEGAVLYGMGCGEPQPIDTRFRFDWTQLPEAR